MPLYTHVVKALDKLGLAYLHFIEPRSSGAGRADVHWDNVPSAMVLFRPLYSGVLMTAGGFTGETANAAIADGHADIIAFGRIFISIPICRAVSSTATRSRRTTARRSIVVRRRDIRTIRCMTN